jgi:hypothetical protein
MSVLNEISSYFTTQNLFGNTLGTTNTTTSTKTEGPDSFSSILKLFDTDADEKVSTDELKFGAGFMINSLLFNKDTNQDQLFSASEVGVPTAVINYLDTNGDQLLSAKEIITPADKIVDGVVSALDLDGDKALSDGEMSIFDLIFNLIQNGIADQTSDPVEVKDAFDLNTLPDRMRQAGFEGTDNQLYYALASTYAEWPWQPDPTDAASIKLSDQRDDIYKWFDSIVNNVAGQMKDDPSLTATAIMNDGPDRLGARLGPAIMKKLGSFGDRVQMGTVYDGNA